MARADWDGRYIAVDWGTSNRRAYLLDEHGAVLDEMADGKGVLTIDDGNFDTAVAEIRSRLGDCPMLLAGMIGSNRGWRNVPYVACPAGAEAIAAGILWVDERTGIVPGVSQNDPADVMRGEEVQALGAIAKGLAAPDSLLCLPGTHNKWLQVKGGKLSSFHTAMTGELFAMFKRDSILSALLMDEVDDGPAFRQGVADAFAGKPLSPALFGIRARHLLGQALDNEASYASGLLIGTDWRDGAAVAAGRAICVIGSPELFKLYAAAALLAGDETIVIDGADAFVAGMGVVKEHIQ